MKTTKRSFLTSLTSLVLCISMLLSTTFAWFTDIAISSGNVIQSGNLDAEMHWSDHLLDADSSDWKNADGVPVFTYDKWEPGYTEVKYIKVSNNGNLNFKWRLSIEADGIVSELADVIDVYYVNPVSSELTSVDGLASVGKLRSVLERRTENIGRLTPGSTAILAIAFHMDELAGNEYQNMSLCKEGFSLKLLVTQEVGESDSFGSEYDADAQWPENIVIGNTASADVQTDSNNRLTADATLTSADGKIGAFVPQGTKLVDGANKVILNVANVENSNANITLSENEASLSIDVHINGVAQDNESVMAITVKQLLPTGLNMGNYRFYHVENGNTVEMTLLPDGQTPVHNNYEYDPATGDVVLHLKSFSEIALVAEPAKWEGKRDYSWYDANATEYKIANADQLAAFGAIVGGMAKQDGEGNIYTSTGVDENATIVQDSFSGKTVRLISDINIGDTNEFYTDASENGIVFYPIGYYNSEEKYEKDTANATVALSSGLRNFEGTFDGNGHLISNFYQNTWEMKGDHDWYDPIKEQYYRDGMGLFGRVYGGTVKNLTVKNFSSDGEITTTGTIAAYADHGALFENIAIIGCNPRVYNIGNGGIVGCVGWYNREVTDTPVIFRNITVDNSNKISALWGSYDVACGGIVGQYYPTSGQTSAGTPKNAGIHFDNCHVGAQMDVYNDVCANYQYYAYRYAGILVGSVRENETIDGRVYPKMDGVTATNCTVHYGDWNDYYYCEIVANTTASYTHDHQMSRLVQVKAVDGKTITYLDGTTGTVPTSGWAHYVVVKTKDAGGNWVHGDGHDFAECYHFNNGEVWEHEDAGYHDGQNGEKFIDENGDGIADLKEDKQLIYREFNNLVTGYGWGVTSKGVEDMDGVTILDKTQADSVTKFEGVDNLTSLETDTTYKISDIFAYLEGCGYNIVPGALAVGVTNLDANGNVIDNGNVVAEFNRDVFEWENGVLTLSGTGKIRITIQDYYFCTSTSIVVDVVEKSNSGTGSVAGSEIHNFTDDGWTSDFYTFAGGQIKDGKHGTYTHDFGSGTETLNYALKFDSNGSIKFTPSVNGKLTIAAASEKSGRTITLNGNQIMSITSAKALVVVTVDVEANVEYTLARGSGESGIYYIAYIPNGSSGESSHTHSYDMETTILAPTCSAKGTLLKTCSCGDSKTEEIDIDPDAHYFINGECLYCGELGDHTHSYTSSITEEATCTKTGIKTYTCACGDSYTEIIPMIPHSYSDSVTKEATCTEAGVKTYSCTCGDSYTEAIVALGHSYVNGICSRCGETSTSAGAQIHDFTANGKDSTFYTISGNLSTSKGTVTYDGKTLTQCLKIESSTNISFTAPKAGTLTLVFVESTPNIKINGTTIDGSNGIITVDVEAGNVAITKDGVVNLFYMVYTPSDAHVHAYVENVKTPATCTTVGEREYVCECGSSYTESIPKLDHSYAVTSTTEASCTANGEKVYTCSGCTASYTEVIPMIPHSWQSGDCTTGKTCTVCGTTEPAAGHTWINANCTTPATCSVCGATEGTALGHLWSEATCEAPETCSRCGITQGEALPHTPGAEATCTTAQVCTVCGFVITAALGHNYENDECTRCGIVKPKVNLDTAGGWFETAYAEWKPVDGADSYDAYYSTAGSKILMHIDDALVRNVNGTYRVDAVGLPAGEYQLTIIPKSGNTELTAETLTTDVIEVLAYDRSGYAHYNNTEGVGAYNDDGTLKDNAIVIYVTNENKNTVSVTSKDGTTVTGIGNILGSTGMDVGNGTNSKGGKANTNQDILRKLAADGTPLVIRIIGSVKGASSTNLSSAVSEIDGLTQYDGVDYGGSVGDNGFMARMSGGKNITIEGIGPDACIDGWGLHFICQTADYANGYGRNFEVRNITFKNVPEDCVGMEGQQEGSTLTAPVERCWIHNCSFIAPAISSPAESDKDGGDGACDFKRGNYFTNSYCYYEGYHKTNLVGSSDSSLQYHLTYHHNYWKNCESRGPLARQADIHMYNNIFDGQTSYCMNPRANAYIFSEYNMFVNCKNPVTVDSGAVKSYHDSFTSCIGDNNATIVTDKSTQVSTSNKYANFDTNASISYIPSGDYIIQEDHAEMKGYVMAYAGVMKQVIVGPEDIDISVIPEDRRPSAAVTLDYDQSLNKNYITSNGTKDNIIFNVSKFNSDSLTVGGNANGIDIVFYVDTTFNATMTEVSGTYSPVLCNAAGIAIITGSGTAENLPAGYYFIQSSGYDVGSSKFKEAKVASLKLERAVVCTEHNYVTRVTAPTCTAGGYTTYTCSNCGYTYQDNQTAAKGHTPGAAATCTSAQTCTTCGTVIAAAIDHNNVDGKCTVCGKIDPETCNHTNTTSKVTAPTCTAGGYTTYTCTACGYAYTGNQTNAKGHTPGDAATCTVAQTCTVCEAVVVAALGHSYSGNSCMRCGAEKPSANFIVADGWFETAYAEWSPMNGAEGYRVSVTPAGSNISTEVNNYLIREYEDYWRVDAVGLKAGNYTITVTPVINGIVDNASSITTDSLSVIAHDRSGYAFVNGTSSGAYNEDGTLKDNAVVVYVTNENKDTVTATIGGQTVTGLSNILSKTYTKNMTTPLCIRFIGNITDLTGGGTAFDKGDLLVENNNNGVGITLEGIGKDAVINGFGFRVKNATNIEIRNLAFMNCDSEEGDNVGLQQGNDHIWVHNCDFFYGDAGSDADQAKGDGQLDTKKSQYVTHSYNHFWDGGKVHLHGNGDTTLNYVSYHHNWYDHCDSRMPRVRVSDSVHVYNNFYDGVSKYGIGATTGCSIFSEANYFLNTARPMMSSKQGTDALGEGTFSGEDGGIIKSYGDVMVFTNDAVEANYSFISYSTNNTSFDAYVATSRGEQVSSSVKTLSGGTSYSNFDTASGFYSYNVESAVQAKDTVTNYSGRINGGDFDFEFTAADDADYAVNTELKEAIVNYESSIVSIGGVKN